MATEHLEIESKFAVSQSVVAPDLTQVEGIAAVASQENQELSAIYFDTPDLRLTRQKITLRRRTGGNDAGWHIKMPADMGRKEIRAGLDAAHSIPTADDAYQVPVDIYAHIRAIVRTHPLQPIAQVDNNRTETVYATAEGQPVLEMCDDHVTAVSFLPGGRETRWREWEIELTENAPESGPEIMLAAADALIAAGAFASTSPSKLATALGDSINHAPLPTSLDESNLDPNSPAAAVVAALRANRDKIVEFDPRVRADEWDSVHQMRVATRELRSHMQTFHGIVEGPQIAHIEAELKMLAGLLGVARDAEVVEERWLKLLETEDSGVLDEATRAHLAQDMGAEYRRAHRHVIAALNSERYLNLLEALDELIANPPVAEAKEEVGAETEAVAEASAAALADATPGIEGESLTASEAAEDKARMEHVMASHLAVAYDKLVARHKKAVKNWDNEELSLHEREEYFHDMRKAAKKLRYAAEAAGSATSLKTKALYAACKNMQSVLGDFQDSVTSRDKLLQLSAAARGRGEDTFGYGLLYQRERAIGLEALEDYADAFQQVKAAFRPLRKKLG